MMDSQIETWSTLFLWFIGSWFAGYTVGWYLFPRLLKLVDDYLQERYFLAKGFQKMLDDKGKVWYVGYDD